MVQGILNKNKEKNGDEDLGLYILWARRKTGMWLVPAAGLALFDSSASVHNTQRGIQATQEAKPCSEKLTAPEGPYKGQGMKIN